MTENEGEYGKKNSGGKGKEYSIRCTSDECVIKYKGKIKHTKPFKWVPLVNAYGETAVKLFEILKIIVGITGMLVAFIALGKMPENLEGLEKYLLGTVILVIFYLSSILVLQGISLKSGTKFLKSLKCKRCRRNNAYEEREKPDIREDSTENSYTVKITRYWKCKYCGYLDSTESSENIKCFKIKKKKPTRVKCEECGATSLVSECRTPDMKIEDYPGGSNITETRYYKCDYCEHINIEAKKTHLNNMEPLASSKIKGRDPRL
ncbi:hypothetical protein RSJ42_00600 [Methanosarcina hadiensis]|uniref:hypothetical protein n=1 Tax=Methanosarcina hadiensis TaxID=3078083 RepID=UPI0039774C4D